LSDDDEMDEHTATATRLLKMTAGEQANGLVVLLYVNREGLGIATSSPHWMAPTPEKLSAIVEMAAMMIAQSSSTLMGVGVEGIFHPKAKGTV
jgi:hypothetical protein